MDIQPKYKCGTKLYHLRDNKLEEVFVDKAKISIVLEETGVFAYNELYYLQPLLGAKYWIDIAEMDGEYFKSKEDLQKSIFG